MLHSIGLCSTVQHYSSWNIRALHITSELFTEHQGYLSAGMSTSVLVFFEGFPKKGNLKIYFKEKEVLVNGHFGQSKIVTNIGDKSLL